MTLSYKARRRLALFILLVVLPIYIVVAVSLIAWLNPTGFFSQLVIYLALGLVWIMPLKFIFKGVGQADPDAPPPDQL